MPPYPHSRMVPGARRKRARFSPKTATTARFYLFALNVDYVPRYHGKVRLYKLKLREKQRDGSYALVRDLVPVKDPATGAPVLWDNVTETYFRNGGKYLLAGGGAERPFESGMTILVR